jgi:hypothetical protein
LFNSRVFSLRTEPGQHQTPAQRLSPPATEISWPVFAFYRKEQCLCQHKLLQAVSRVESLTA